MSPRAAWRLESLGFQNVYDYKPGKLDWMAAGLPTEGAHTSKRRAGDLAKMDEKLVDVRKRVKDAVVVVNEHNIVMGILRSKELQQDGNLTIEKAMHSGPSTF